MNARFVWIIAVGVAACALVFWYNVLWRLVIQYRVTDTAFSVRLFGRICLYRARLEDIWEARNITFTDAMLGRTHGPSETQGVAGWLSIPLMIPNKIPTRLVLIRKRGGILRDIIITPDSPGEFLEELVASIGKKKNANTASADARARP